MYPPQISLGFFRNGLSSENKATQIDQKRYSFFDQNLTMESGPNRWAFYTLHFAVTLLHLNSIVATSVSSISSIVIEFQTGKQPSWRGSWLWGIDSFFPNQFSRRTWLLWNLIHCAIENALLSFSMFIKTRPRTQQSRFFTPDSPYEFSVHPTNGVLPPATRIPVLLLILGAIFVEFISWRSVYDLDSQNFNSSS